jgi:hypothetical protein
MLPPLPRLSLCILLYVLNTYIVSCVLEGIVYEVPGLLQQLPLGVHRVVAQLAATQQDASTEVQYSMAVLGTACCNVAVCLY